MVQEVDDEQLQELGFSQEELLARYASASHWLMARAGMANARRKQQFIYWKKHAQLLGRDMTEEAPAVAEWPVDAVALPQPAAAPSQASRPTPAKSMATSVTKMDLKAIGPNDMRSVISHRSCVSTVVSPRGEDLAWPPVPSHLAGHNVHQIYDLQPYYCTYEDCLHPSRLYGVKQEWIDHGNQHRRVWHCHSHEAEFEIQLEYLQHLKEQHPEVEPEDYTPEMIAAAVGVSAEPHRGCPFCPTMFSDKYHTYHLVSRVTRCQALWIS
ncbi:hypothetical protein B0H67DRAFT_549596 [Lasiosphaeris hirsuta]|uniref:C2H2-type domain-containing protein n=1 Tax=Lasiosphaeris hirsuta TaxID=260670 RepID=A0AA40BCY1_9PEZI|nr:hypothetical protein B0H67DRAFT_549596 [Lasiosphaeris hirsuta]